MLQFKLSPLAHHLEQFTSIPFLKGKAESTSKLVLPKLYHDFFLKKKLHHDHDYGEA